MLQQGKDLAFFRNRETSKGGLQLLGLLMKTEFFNMRSCCNPMHFKTTFKNSRRSLFYQDFIFQLFELWLLLHIHHVLHLFHILIRQCTFSRPTVCNNQAWYHHGSTSDKFQSSLSSNHISWRTIKRRSMTSTEKYLLWEFFNQKRLREKTWQCLWIFRRKVWMQP